MDFHTASRPYASRNTCLWACVALKIACLFAVPFLTGIPLTKTEPLLLAFIAFKFLAAINEGSGRFVDED